MLTSARLQGWIRSLILWCRTLSAVVQMVPMKRCCDQVERSKVYMLESFVVRRVSRNEDMCNKVLQSPDSGWRISQLSSKGIACVEVISGAG